MSDSQEKTKGDAALREEAILEFWRDRDIFKKSLKKPAPNGEFVFYDGPPFATGLPHSGSLLSSVIKDVVGRYKTMRGYYVRRRWGWDCHGLPIENAIEKKLGLKTKKDIEKLGIAVFNEEARKSVLTYVHDWKQYIERIGRWVDFDNSYKTMDNTYIESVWWGIKQMYDKGLLYEGRKVLMYCPHCETPLAKAEIAMDHSYKDVTDDAITVRFKIKDQNNTYLLAWTTTPWTLPANVALAVGKNIEYVLLEKGAEKYIVAKELAEQIADAKEIKKVPSEELVGLSYEPLYDVQKNKTDTAYKVYVGDFVTTGEGTGIVHIAPVYGEDDYALGLKYTLPIVPLLNASGHYNDDAPEFLRGEYFKKANQNVIEDLQKEERGLLFAQEKHTHSYPHCYRCGTALIYNALTSWFVNIQKIKARLLELNESINWYPEHLKHGRFQNIVADAPDWGISRNRFWASPLPIWKHETTGDVKVLGSLDELKQYVKKSGNRYVVMRHGEADNNVLDLLSSKADAPHHVTEKGKAQIEAQVALLKEKKITRIVVSPFVRTRDTVGMIQKALGLADTQITFDARLGEVNYGVSDATSSAAYNDSLPALTDRFFDAPEGAETWSDVRRRVGACLYGLENTYANETILIVTHESPWILLFGVAEGLSVHEIHDRYNNARPNNAQVQELAFVPLPHNADFELDYHRPYIDELELVAEDGARLVRIPEVVDCWLESGSMPFAEYHYPFENKSDFEKRSPGDFIAEYIAQTRTWFYYMHVVGTALFDRQTFKHVVTTGNILADDGSKMSKSKANYTDPLINIDRFGSDALRLYLLTSVVMQAEDARFRDEELRDVHNRIINILWNAYTFYSLHATDETLPDPLTSTHVLDRWILARLSLLVQETTQALDAFDTIKAGRVLRDFITDLSTWYVRRSRDRFKEDSEDKTYVLAVSRYVFEHVALLIAPITPFIAEEIYRGVMGKEESVHLAEWPSLHELTKEDKQLLLDMEDVRRTVSLGLEARARSGIKVRQPLAKLTLKKEGEKELPKELLVLIQDEVNVALVEYGDTGGEEVLLDTTMTDELMQEGRARDLVRCVQDLRKRAALTPNESIRLFVETKTQDQAFFDTNKERLQRIAGVQEILYEKTESMTDVVIGDGKASLSIERIERS